VPARPATTESYRKLVVDARRHLRRDPCQSTAELARKLPCSVRTLNRAFAATGSTVREERHPLRLHRAALVLLAAMPPAEAARHAGYASSQQLIDPFRRYFGVTPARMRQIGHSVKTVTWQAKQPGPYRGTWHQRQRERAWRAHRHVLLTARGELVAGTIAAQKVEVALAKRLPRPRAPKAPLKLWNMFEAFASEMPSGAPRTFRRAA